MKTVVEILLGFYPSGILPNYITKEIIYKAMKLYAEQAIERCAEVAEVVWNGEYEATACAVNRKEILDVKKELK
jgi:hypothetical protein